MLEPKKLGQTPLIGTGYSDSKISLEHPVKFRKCLGTLGQSHDSQASLIRLHETKLSIRRPCSVSLGSLNQLLRSIPT